MDVFDLIAIECENCWIWLGVCKHFWSSTLLLGKLLTTCTKRDDIYFSTSIRPYGIFSNWDISIYSPTSTGWILTYSRGAYIDSYVDHENRFYVLGNSDLDTRCQIQEYLYPKNVFSESEVDCVTIHDIIKQRARTYKRITGNSVPNRLIRKICADYFTDQLEGKDLFDKYLMVILSARSLLIPVSYKVEINYLETENEQLIDEAWEAVNAQIDRDELEKLIEKIYRKIAKL